MSEPPAGPAPPPAGTSRAPRKKTSTLTILLAVIGGGLLLVFAIGALVAYKVMSSPEGRTIVGAVGETMRVMRKAQSAPGTKELRKLGCNQPMAMDLEDLARITQTMDRPPPPPGAFRTMVLCPVSLWSTPPSCEEVASTYVRAIGPSDRAFLVMVQQSGKQKPHCSALFDGAGVLTGAIDDAEPPPFEPVE